MPLNRAAFFVSEIEHRHCINRLACGKNKVGYGVPSMVARFN
jgi:hypothetical protein